MSTSSSKMAQAAAMVSSSMGDRQGDRQGDSHGDKVVFSVVQTFPAPPDPSAATKKRASSSSASRGGPDTDATSDDGSGGDGDKAKRSRTSRVSKPRKPSHVVIREEKERLRTELELLEARVATLRRRAGLPDTHEVAVTRAVATENAVLADAVRRHERLVADAHAALSDFVHTRASNPLRGFVHLGKEVGERSAEVMALKADKLAHAERFLTERVRLADPLANGVVHEESGVVTPGGDYVLIKLDTTCFRGVDSVRQVFEAMKFYFVNLEIANSELSGNVTVREDSAVSDDMDAADHASSAVLAHRLVTLLSSGVLMEKNALKYMELYPGERPDDARAVLAAVPIDQDDLYPYSSSGRLRMDMTAAMKLSARYESAPPGTNGGRRLVVVFTRWFRVELRHNEALGIPDFVMQGIRQSMSERLNSIVKSMGQTLYGIPTA